MNNWGLIENRFYLMSDENIDIFNISNKLKGQIKKKKRTNNTE
jgi:hypothetical protein